MRISSTSSRRRVKIRLRIFESRLAALSSEIRRLSSNPVTAAITKILEWRDLASPFPTKVKKAQFERRNASCLPALCFLGAAFGVVAPRE